VDLAKFEIIARYYTGGQPHNTLCSPDGKRFYLAPQGDPKKVTVLEVGTWKAVAEIPFSDAVRPVALTQDEKRLYACVDGLVGMEVADVPGHKMIHRIVDELTDEEKKVPSRSHGLAVRPDQQEVWECDVGHHEVHVYDISADKPRQMATVPIGSEVYWLTFRPDGKVCYVSARGGGQVVAVDADTKKVVARIPVGKEPKRLLVVTLPEGPKK
jgi:YVTN family beta-propeller protein